jgi:hypothetical protein
MIDQPSDFALASSYRSVSRPRDAKQRMFAPKMSRNESEWCQTIRSEFTSLSRVILSKGAEK